MAKLVVTRLVWSIPVILLVIFMTFMLMRQIEGNPFRQTERAVPAAVQANLERKFNLDKPWYLQYAYYVKGVFTFDLGPSLVVRGRDVNDIVTTHFPKSVELGLYAFLFARLVRGTMLETLQQDYVRTARAKGLRYRRVVGLHVLRNSLIPVITAAGPLLGFIITGSFVIELIFNIPGIGQSYIDSVLNRDFSVVMGLTVLLSVIVIIANLVVDI